MTEVFNQFFPDVNPKLRKLGRYNVNWVNDLPKLELGESPYAVLRFAFVFNGERLIEDIDDYDAVSCPLKPFFSHTELGISKH